MNTLIMPVIIGVVIIVMGCMHMKGNISTLHSYHRKRVTEEDRIPFGRKVGTGSIMIGCALILKACLDYAAGSMNNPMLNTAGTAALVIGFVTGTALIVYAMMKYNKGIF